MAKQKGSRQFTISAQVHVETTYDVQAASLEDAVAKANELKVVDFVTLSGDHNDSRHEIVGVFESFTQL